MAPVAGPDALRKLLDAVVTVGSDLDLPAVLQRITQAAVDLVDARYGALGVLDETRTRLGQFLTVGLDERARAAIGPLPEGHGILGLLIVDARPIRLPDLHAHPDSYGFPPHHPHMRSFLGVPIRVAGEVFGNLYLTDKTSADEFTEVDEELVVGLAAAAGVAIDNARLHARVRRLALVEDRARIARDLHDTVIQDIFATGLSLQAAAALIRTDPDTATGRVEAAVDHLDGTVRQVRSTIFDLETAVDEDGRGLRRQVLDVVRDSMRSFGFEPRVVFEGPVDSATPDEVAPDLIASLRELLSNAARHARAHRVDVRLQAADEVLVLTVVDDGIGPPGPDRPRGHGLDNIAARAERRGGSAGVRAGEHGGTIAEWRVPLG